MTPEEVSDLERAPRYLEVVLGVACGAIGFTSLAILAFGLFRLSIADAFTLSPGDLGVFLGFGFVGYFMSVVGWRLLSGRGRKADGGLLPPVMLRIGGGCFVLGGGAVAFTGWTGVITAIGLVVMGVTCFALARHRERSMSHERGIEGA